MDPLTDGLLADVLIVELPHVLAGPHAALMLGDLGARSVTVEHPEADDEPRRWGPPIVGPQDASESTYFPSWNRNKESITLTLGVADVRWDGL